MTVDDDPRLFYYNLDRLVRELPDRALHSIGQTLTASMPGRDWRAIGDRLGYTWTQMDTFEHRQKPAGYELLKDWATRQKSTIRVLQSKLQQIERNDIVLQLNDIRQSPINLDVVIHDAGRGHSHTPEIRGQKELWDGLLELVKSHVSTVTPQHRYTFFNLREPSWQNQCRDYQGQQVDIDVIHQDTMPGVSVNPRDIARELEPSWHLMSPTQLRYSRNHCDVGTGNTSSEGARAFSSGTSYRPEVEPKCTRGGESRAAWASGNGANCKSEGKRHPTQESVKEWDSAEGSKSLKKHVSFSCTKENNAHSSGYFHGTRDLPTQETMGLDHDTVKFPVVAETTKHSLDLDLRSFEGLPGTRELHENTRTQLMDLNLRSDDTSSRIHEKDMASGSETICLKSDVSLSDNNNLKEVRDQRSDSSAVVAMALSSSAAGPREESVGDLLELRGCDLPPENENLVSEEIVKDEETKEQQSHSLTRRHVYFLPKPELIRSQYPRLWDLPGFHPKLKHKISMISEVMKPYEKMDGWYLIRAFVSDENLAKVDLALTVTYKGKLKHFLILQQWESNPRRYFLFNSDYDSISISDLIDHYKTYPLIPGSVLVKGRNLPKLVHPIPRDSFNYM